MRKPKTIVTTLVAGFALAIPTMAVTAEPAQAHKVTNRSCAVTALQKAREATPATTREVQIRAAACRTAGARHNARHVALCNTSATAAIRCVFGPVAPQAITIAKCESGLRTWALGPRDEYGVQRPGLFQLGTYERRKAGWYTHRSDAMTQAKSAYNWYAMTGYDWGAWECTA